jgi:hypothetical protein
MKDVKDPRLHSVTIRRSGVGCLRNAKIYFVEMAKTNALLKLKRDWSGKRIHTPGAGQEIAVAFCAGTDVYS